VAQVFPTDPYVLSSLVAYVLSTLTESFRQRIDELAQETPAPGGRTLSFAKFWLLLLLLLFF
jgi:hypothetical protein